LILIIHTMLCLLAMALIFVTPHLFSALFPSGNIGLSGGFVLLSIIIHIALLIYFYASRKYSVFALPLSHIVFPVLYYFVMMLLWKYSSVWKAFEASWESFVSILSVFYFLPISIITLVISIVIKLRSNK